jgi:hypothetical protein
MTTTPVLRTLTEKLLVILMCRLLDVEAEVYRGTCVSFGIGNTGEVNSFIASAAGGAFHGLGFWVWRVVDLDIILPDWTVVLLHTA